MFGMIKIVLGNQIADIKETIIRSYFRPFFPSS